jgi:O-antigen/teichoic acid export membrane protein
MDKVKSSMPNKVFSGMIWTAWGKISRTVLQFTVLVLLARLMTPFDFGVIGAAMIVVGFSEILTKVGFGPALVQRDELEERHIRTAFSVSLMLSVLVGVTVFASAPLIASFFNFEGLATVLRALSLLFLIKGVGLVAESLAQRELDFKTLANAETVSFFVGYFVFGVPMALLGFGVWSLVVANLATASVKTLIMYWYYPAAGVIPERKAFSELAYFGGGYTIARVANHLALEGDYLVVGRAMGMSALGIYGRSYQLMSVPASSLGQVLDEVLFPSMSKIQNDRARLASIYLRGVSLVALVMLPVSVLSIIMAPEIVRATLGWKWGAVVLPFQILMAGLLMRTSYKMSDSLTRASGAVYRRAWRQMIYAGLVFSGAFVGRNWGVEGVAVGVLGAVTVNYLLMAQMSIRLVGESWRTFVRAHANAALLAVCLGVAALPAATILRSLNISSYLFLATMIAYLAACALLMIRISPNALLGTEGVWMLEFLRTYAADKFAARNVVEADGSAG